MVEDNSDMRSFIHDILMENYQVITAQNGVHALDLLENGALEKENKFLPQLIITDIMMPQMDGITLCKKLKTHIITSHIPIIMLTSRKLYIHS